MGFRFQKRIRIFKGLTLNLNKSDSSWTVGRPGTSVNFRGDKVSGNVGIPGSDIFRAHRANPFSFPTARPNYLSNLMPVSHCNRESVLRRVPVLQSGRAGWIRIQSIENKRTASSR